MGTLYENIDELCSGKRISINKMCTDLGMRNSVISDLKMGRKKGLNAETLNKIASYFGVSVDYLLGNEPKEKAPAESEGISDDDIKFALFNGADGVTDEMYEEVKRFAQFIKDRENR